MRVLLDTNILIHRETSFAVNEDIGRLFFWLDKVKAEKFIHYKSIEEINGHQDDRVKKSFSIKLQSYVVIESDISLHPIITKVISTNDHDINSKIDSILINEVLRGRVDYLITEDRGIHRKAGIIGLNDSIFTIEQFIEKTTLAFPKLKDYKVLSVSKQKFSDVDINSSFFDSFKEDYTGFEKWFLRKSDEFCFTCYTDGQLSAFLFLKVEDQSELYVDINPLFPPKRRLKIGTLKVTLNGLRLGERFLKIVFDNALLNTVDEIYVTIFPKRPEQKRLINMILEWGFSLHGIKVSDNGEEQVYTRSFFNHTGYSTPLASFPFISKLKTPYFVPIWPDYHTTLLPDSILNTESPLDYKENRPVSNAIRKSYISHSYERALKAGDPIFFYRTGGKYIGVLTSIGIVEKVHNNIDSLEQLIEITQKKTVLSEEQLGDFWNRYPRLKPFVVDFLYAYSLPKRPNLDNLITSGIISDINNVPRGFSKLTWDQVATIFNLSNGNKGIIID